MTLLGKIQDILNLIFRIEKFSVYDQWVRTLHLQCTMYINQKIIKQKARHSRCTIFCFYYLGLLYNC